MPDRWATDDFISALDRYGVLEVDDENGVATIISHIEVVTEVDSASLINRRLDQLPSLLHGNRNDSIHVGQIATLVVLGVNVVVKIEKSSAALDRNASASSTVAQANPGQELSATERRAVPADGRHEAASLIYECPLGRKRTLRQGTMRTRA
jgi:hypothetical protein